MADKPAIPLTGAIKAGDFIYVSGMVAAQENGEFFVGDFPKEVNLTIDSLERKLATHGADLSHVIKVGAYLSNPLLFAEFNKVYAERFTESRPTRTTVAVFFAHPNVRVEMDCVAYVGNDRS
ncbi:RidA family protein [Propionibacteriaceae bacterium Y2011]|uniref:RidA family protein n=1 Tax=Microlunatus sp. Y2014 TaxID=3418488 RepID=UPI003B4BA231